MEGEETNVNTQKETKLTAFRRGSQNRGTPGSHTGNTDRTPNINGISRTSSSSSSRSDGNGETNRDSRLVSGDSNVERSGEPSENSVGTSPGTIEPSGIIETRSGGTGRSTDGIPGNKYGIEPRREDESREDYQRRYKREVTRIRRAEAKSASSHQEVNLEESFEITVETPAILGEISSATSKPKKERKATPKRSSSAKYKEPTKEQLNQTAEQLKQIYGTMDILVGGAMGLAGKPYIDGMLQLQEDKAQQMGRALAQMNVNFPEWANRINAVSAPAVFFGLLITDIGMKGLALYGLAKQPKQTQGFTSGNVITASK